MSELIEYCLGGKYLELFRISAIFLFEWVLQKVYVEDVLVLLAKRGLSRTEFDPRGATQDDFTTDKLIFM